MPPVTRREIVALALPAMVSAILSNGWRVLSQHAVADLGVAAQAAVGSCTFVVIATFAAYALVFAGTGPLVARATGAGDDVLRRRVIGNALTGALGVALISGILLWALAPAIAGLLGLTGAPAVEAASYLRGVALASAPLALEPVIDAALIAMGRTGLALSMQTLGVALNMAMNRLFIHVLGFGVMGAALSTGASRALAVLAGLAVLRALSGLRASDLRVDGTLTRVGRIGLPIALNTLAYALVYWALLRVAVSPLGPEVNAALGVGFSALESFTWPAFLGVSLGVASVVGRRLGAGEPEQARAAVRLALPLSVGLGLVAAAAFWFGAAPLSALFTDDPAVLAQAVVYARVLAFSQLFVALEALFEGGLEGAGDTRTLLFWSAPLNALRVPLGWALAIPLGWGAAGVWWAINLTTFAKALGKGYAIARGRWLHVQV